MVELRKPVGVEPSTALLQAFENLTSLTDFAYQMGYHEMGYCPVRFVRDAYDTLAQSSARTIAGLTNDALSMRLQRDQAQQDYARCSNARDAIAAEMRGLREVLEQQTKSNLAWHDALNACRERERQLRGLNEDLLKICEGTCPACGGNDLHSAEIDGKAAISCCDCEWNTTYAALAASPAPPDPQTSPVEGYSPHFLRQIGPMPS